MPHLELPHEIEIGLVTAGGRAMIRFQKSALIRTDQISEATTWAKELAEYVNARYPQYPVQAYVERTGDAGVIHWIADFSD